MGYVLDETATVATMGFLVQPRPRRLGTAKCPTSQATGPAITVDLGAPRCPSTAVISTRSAVSTSAVGAPSATELTAQ